MSLSEREWRILAAIEVDTRRSDSAFADALTGPAGDPRRRRLGLPAAPPPPAWPPVH